jgi:hypothetical protein
MLRGIAAYVRRHHIALLALFFALGGTAFAAGTALLPKNSVGSAQVINGSLQKSDLSGKAFKALKGNRGLRGAQGTAGAAGPAGAQGARGPTGPQGVPGLTGLHIVSSSFFTVPANSQTSGNVACPAGEVATGGGAFSSSGAVTSNINTSIPTTAGWRADVNNGSASSTSFAVYAVCAKVS